MAEELRGRSRLSAEARNYVAYIPVPLNDEDDEEETDEDTGGSESYYDDEDEYYEDVSVRRIRSGH